MHENLLSLFLFFFSNFDSIHALDADTDGWNVFFLKVHHDEVKRKQSDEQKPAYC